MSTQFASNNRTPNGPLSNLDDENSSGLASTDYARRCRELMELNRALYDMGAETLVDLPRIAVIGGQSTGKSSLVEAVSGISVPRDAGTCTRCPMQCTVSSSTETWSCTVSLHFYDDGKGNHTHDVQPFGPVITDKSEVEIWLRRAQAAILSHPRTSSDHFSTKTVQELRNGTNAQMFSKNVVCVDINDPDATDLSFVDLPGLIQNSTDDAIALVKNLVESYIKSKKTLILIAIPVSDDIENQQAVRLAKEADREGRRTIGVLTKPDTLTKGATTSRQRWKEILQGSSKDHRLKLGYYCVRLPDDEERLRNISHNESHRLAAKLFRTTKPWNEIEDRTRFGIPSLVSNLGRLLVDLIEENLPMLLQDVNKLLKDCQQSLDQLPPPLTVDPSTEILTRISAFCQDIKGAVNGERLKTLAQKNRLRYSQWMARIRGTTPDFRPFVDYTRFLTFSWDGLLGAIVSSDHRPVLKVDNNPIAPPEVAVEIFDLTKIREVIDDSISWELPFNVPYEAKKCLIWKSISLWKTPTLSCFECVYDNLSDVLYTFIEHHFGRFKQLRDYIESLVRNEVKDHKNGARRALLKTLALEEDPVFTQNLEFFQSERAKWLSKYQTTYPDPWQTERKKPAQNSRQFEEEMTVMADVRAYFEVAYRRIIDCVPLTIEHELCQTFANNLQPTLFQNIFGERGLSGERQKELVGEDPEVVARRRLLEDRKKRLVEIKEKLDGASMRTRMRAPAWRDEKPESPVEAKEIESDMDQPGSMDEELIDGSMHPEEDAFEESGPMALEWVRNYA